MKKVIFLTPFLLYACISFGQKRMEQAKANAINELFVANIDSNQVIFIDKQGVINIMTKDKDENIDFNILDLSKIEVVDSGTTTPNLSVVFDCNHCMHITAFSLDRREHFNNTHCSVPIRYRGMAEKMVTMIYDARKQMK